MLKWKKKYKIADYLLIIIGSTVLAIGINSYFEPLGLVTGGVTGISIIIKHLTEEIMGGGIPLSISNLIINIPLFLIAFLIHGKESGIKSLFATFYLSFALEYTKFLPQIENDLFLGSVFGAVLGGIGLGIVFVTGATTGGTDLAGSILQHFFPNLSTAKWMQLIDTLIILLGFMFFGAEKAMYALIAVYIVTKVIDALLEGLNFSKAAFIISDNYEELAKGIMKELDRGVTVLHGMGMYTHQEKEILLCVMSKRQILGVKEVVRRIDPAAFMIVTDAREVFGEGFIENPELEKRKKERTPHQNS